MMAVSMAQVLLIRPGATLYDEQNRVQGVLDIPLSERGHAEATRLANSLAETQDSTPLSALYCGPGENVIRTAEIIGKALGLRPRRIDEFRNLDQGLWQGLQIEEIKRRNTKLFRQWIDDPRTICPPQGETIEDAMERVKAALKPLIRRHQEGDSSAWSWASRWPGWSRATSAAPFASSSTSSCPAAAGSGSRSRRTCWSTASLDNPRQEHDLGGTRRRGTCRPLAATNELEDLPDQEEEPHGPTRRRIAERLARALRIEAGSGRRLDALRRMPGHALSQAGRAER